MSRKIIYLDDAIDCVCYDQEYTIECLEKLPSAQQEPIKINIDDFNKEDWERLKKEWGNTPITVLSAQPEDICSECDAWNVYKNYVQPEIMRCKNCKHKPSGSGANHDISFPDEVCPCQCEDYWYSWMPKDDWFCGSWERRTDETV